jgi:hypothetical protein
MKGLDKMVDFAVTRTVDCSWLAIMPELQFATLYTQFAKKCLEGCDLLKPVARASRHGSIKSCN